MKNIKKIAQTNALFLAIILSACAPNKEQQTADIIYSDGDIITMVDSSLMVEAIAVKDGKILATGNKSEIAAYKGKTTKTIDLQGKTLLPGFIDAHGHFSQVGLLSQSANVAARPDGNTNDIKTLLENLKKHVDSPQAKELGWIIGMNYDDSQLAENRHPTAVDLDKVSLDQPVMIIHQSSHLGVVNTIGLEKLGYTSSTKNPEGGVIRRIEGSNQPNGVLEETAFFGAALKVIAPKSEKSLLEMIASAQKAYFTAGFTTTQEGRASEENVKGVAAAANAHLLDIDVVIFTDPTFFSSDEAYNQLMSTKSSDYSDHYRIGGMKLSLDGSPQGKTAWLTAPYHVVPNGLKKDYAGYPAMKDVDVDKYVDLAYQNKWQILVHSNGDAASDQFISALTKATNNHKNVDVRPVIIHAQIIREEQLDSMKELNVIPSFMSVHTFYWGDWHRDSVLGDVRANRISPAKSALDRNLLYTSHNDSPVTLPNALMILSSQVNRLTRNGKVLGEGQKVPVMEALKSITVNAAYQYFEENSKGSLESGKVADFVILDKNPLKIDPIDLNKIQVIETIKAGKTVYSK